MNAMVINLMIRVNEKMTDYLKKVIGKWKRHSQLAWFGQTFWGDK